MPAPKFRLDRRWANGEIDAGAKFIAALGRRRNRQLHRDPACYRRDRRSNYASTTETPCG